MSWTKLYNVLFCNIYTIEVYPTETDIKKLIFHFRVFFDFYQRKQHFKNLRNNQIVKT